MDPELLRLLGITGARLQPPPGNLLSRLVAPADAASVAGPPRTLPPAPEPAQAIARLAGQAAPQDATFTGRQTGAGYEPGTYSDTRFLQPGDNDIVERLIGLMGSSGVSTVLGMVGGPVSVGKMRVFKNPFARSRSEAYMILDDVGQPVGRDFYPTQKQAVDHAKSLQGIGGATPVTPAPGRAVAPRSMMGQGERVFRMPNGRELQSLRLEGGKWAVWEKGKTFIRQTPEGDFLIRSGQGLSRAERHMPIDLSDIESLRNTPGIQLFDSFDEMNEAVQHIARQVR